jgi:hypothetical protein
MRGVGRGGNVPSVFHVARYVTWTCRRSGPFPARDNLGLHRWERAAVTPNCNVPATNGAVRHGSRLSRLVREYGRPLRVFAIAMPGPGIARALVGLRISGPPGTAASELAIGLGILLDQGPIGGVVLRMGNGVGTPLVRNRHRDAGLGVPVAAWCGGAAGHALVAQSRGRVADATFVGRPIFPPPVEGPRACPDRGPPSR